MSRLSLELYFEPQAIIAAIGSNSQILQEKYPCTLSIRLTNKGVRRSSLKVGHSKIQILLYKHEGITREIILTDYWN